MIKTYATKKLYIDGIYNKYRFISANYEGLGFFTRLIILIRWLSSPLNQLERMCPKEGRILDIGCSFGIFDLLLVNRRTNREVFGIDPDEKKIKTAKVLQEKYSKLNLDAGFLEDFEFGFNFDAVYLVDILYLLPNKEKIKILKRVKKIIKPKGVIIINTIEKKLTLAFLFVLLQEFLSVLVLKHTFSKSRKLFFEDAKAFENIFIRAGLELRKKIKTKALFYPYTIYTLSPPIK